MQSIYAKPASARRASPREDPPRDLLGNLLIRIQSARSRGATHALRWSEPARGEPVIGMATARGPMLRVSAHLYNRAGQADLLAAACVRSV
jgi:hypothetical protein